MYWILLQWHDVPHWFHFWYQQNVKHAIYLSFFNIHVEGINYSEYPCHSNNLEGFQIQLTKLYTNITVYQAMFTEVQTNPDYKVLGANMGPTWVLLAPDGPHVGPMNLAIREWLHSHIGYLKREVRQDYPLSPYLVILLAEQLSCKIQESKATRIITK